MMIKDSSWKKREDRNTSHYTNSVSINDYSSSLSNIFTGVVLHGPFLIHINYLPNSSQLLSFFLFTDDTNIYCNSDNLQLLTRKVNRELNKVKHWLDSNKLSLKIDKTNFLLFQPPPPPRQNCQTLKSVNKLSPSLFYEGLSLVLISLST